MEEGRQPVKVNARLSPERLMQLMQQSSAWKHLHKQSGIRRLPTHIPSTSGPVAADGSVPVARFPSIDLGTRCEACLSLSPERLEVDFGHLSRRATTGVLHHNFDDLKKSAANGCNLCRVLVWAVYRTTHSNMRTLARNIDRISSSNERLYLRLTKAHLGYILKPSLALCIPTTNSTSECQQDSGGINTIKWAKVAQANVYTEPPALETVSISDYPDSKELYSLIQKWLENCRENHATCKAVSQQVESKVLPKRLIDVGTADGVETPRVIRTEELVAKGGFRKIVYAALSYVWGASGNHILLTKVNTDSFSHGIESSSLPKTFQDAILVCQKLSVKYLWIDALCILQSPPEDGSPNEELSQQIAIMGQIYANAVFTIAAASASSVHEGLFRPEKRFPTSLQSHPVYALPSENQWYVTPPEPDWRATITNGPLQQRGWVMQERTLSRRILHCTHWTVFWECTELKASEFRPADIMSAYPLYDPQVAVPFSGCYKGLPIASKMPLSIQETTELLTSVWAVAVSDYTNRCLTSETDILPAISAVAQTFQELTGDIYLAGLWQSVLWLNLMWHTSNVGAKLPRRPTRYTAPSWSWASVIGSIVLTVRDPPDSQSLTVLSVSTTSISMSNPYGQVKNGALRLRGALRKDFRATRRRTNALVEHYIQKPPSSSPAEMVVDGVPVKFEVPDLNRPESMVYFDIRSDDELGFCILQICGLMQSGFKRQGHPFFYAMAIVPTHMDGEYRRIGLVHVCDERFFDGPEAEITTITLV